MLDEECKAWIVFETLTLWLLSNCSKMFKEPRPVFISFAIRSATPIALIRRGCVMMMFASEGLSNAQCSKWNSNIIFSMHTTSTLFVQIFVFFWWFHLYSCDTTTNLKKAVGMMWSSQAAAPAWPLASQSSKMNLTKTQKNKLKWTNCGKIWKNPWKRTTTKKIKVITSENAWCFSLMRILKYVCNFLYMFGMSESTGIVSEKSWCIQACLAPVQKTFNEKLLRF